MRATCPRARAVLGVRQLHQAAGADDLDGVGAGPSWPTADDGVGRGGTCSQGSLVFVSFVSCEESRKNPMGACNASAMSFVNIILIMEWCKMLALSWLGSPFLTSQGPGALR